MIKNILDHNHDFKLNLQSDIDRFRQTLEEEYAKSDDGNEGFKEISNKLVTKLLSMLRKASAENNLLKKSAELDRISRLITIFINQYPEVSETKFGNDLKSWLNLVQINALGFEWIGRLDNAIQSKDQLGQIRV